MIRQKDDHLFPDSSCQWVTDTAEIKTAGKGEPLCRFYYSKIESLGGSPARHPHRKASLACFFLGFTSTPGLPHSYPCSQSWPWLCRPGKQWGRRAAILKYHPFLSLPKCHAVFSLTQLCP